MANKDFHTGKPSSTAARLHPASVIRLHPINPSANYIAQWSGTHPRDTCE